METYKPKIKQERIPKDVSAEFLRMDPHEFYDFLKTQRQEPLLSIKIDWIDGATTIRLKAFLDDFYPGQKRRATIRATRAQYESSPNVFASGVKWEKIQE